jgi:hypothetical protein
MQQAQGFSLNLRPSKSKYATSYFLLDKAAENISPNVLFPRDLHGVMLDARGDNFTFTLTNLGIPSDYVNIIRQFFPCIFPNPTCF